jgi:hypothetical protein
MKIMFLLPMRKIAGIARKWYGKVVAGPSDGMRNFCRVSWPIDCVYQEVNLLR